MTSSSSALSAMEAQTIAQYIHTFLDLVENMPNEMSRHLTQLHQLNNNYLNLINKMDVYVNRFNASNTPINVKIRIGKRIESVLIQMQELADEKLRFAQNIVDLTESKTKELDADYDEVLYVNHLIETNNTNNYNNNNSKNNLKIMSTNGGKNSVISINGLTDDEKITLNGESNDSKQSDKRLLPRRACALKTGDTSEPQVIQKLPKRAKKNCQRKYSSKSGNFQLAMTKIYRDMALRRAKLPIKKQKSVSLSYKRNTNRKSVPKYKNRSIVRSLSGKHLKPSNVEQYIRNENKANSNKKSLSSSSSTLSQSSISSTLSSTTSSSVSVSVSASASKRNNKSVKTSSSQSDVNRDKKRATNHIQVIGNSNNNSSSKWSSKKGKIQNDESNYSMFVGEPIDPNEPRYCLCDQVSYGEMICCDNQSCSIEWFHFNCVDLEHKPKGKWYCPNCRGDRSNVPKK